MIQDPSKDLTLIVYNTPKPPRYIKVNKKLMSSLVFAIPFLVVFSVSFSIFISYYMKRKIDLVQSQEPEKIMKLKATQVELSQKISLLEASNAELTKKISAGPATGSQKGILGLLATPLGFEDKRSLEKTKIDNFSNQISKKKMTFKFDIINNQKEGQKLAGYITIIQYHSYGINVYPDQPLAKENHLIKYSSGESFNVSRFRPVIADFPIPGNSASVWYKIFIFSRTGNLLALQTTEEYPVN